MVVLDERPRQFLAGYLSLALVCWVLVKTSGVRLWPRLRRGLGEGIVEAIVIVCAVRSMGLWHLVRKSMGNLPKWASGLFIVGGLTVPRAASGLRES